MHNNVKIIKRIVVVCSRDNTMKARVGSLLFMQDRNDATKKRPYICVQICRNNAGVPYNWIIVPITSALTVGEDYLTEVKHKMLTLKSYAKISNIESVSWRDEIKVVKERFDTQYVRDVQKKLRNIFT